MAHSKKAVCLVVCVLSVWRVSPCGGGTPHDFVTQDLLTHLANDSFFDWHRVASLSFPLAMRVKRCELEADRRPLLKVANLLANIDSADLSCSDAINAALTAGFLADAGVTTAIDNLVFPCREDSSPFETVNALLFRCRYGIARDDQAVRAAVSRMRALQQTDGRFTFPGLTFLETYYLSSHFLITFYACGVSKIAIVHVQDFLHKTLSLFRHTDFLDGLAESLLFLAWTKAIPPTWAAHVAFLRARVRSDGGICFVDRPGCLSHWHTTALMAEIESLDLFLRQHGVLPPGPLRPSNRIIGSRNTSFEEPIEDIEYGEHGKDQ